MLAALVVNSVKKLEGKDLSSREKSVIRYAALGLTNSEIATQHGTTMLTEKKRIAIILKKLNARNRAHAVALAIWRGIIEPPEELRDATSIVQTRERTTTPRKKYGSRTGPPKIRRRNTTV